MLIWNVTESQTASHVCNSRCTALPRTVLDPDDNSETAFLPAVPYTVFENHWHGRSKHLSELTNVGNFLPKLDRFRLFSAFPCWPLHGSPTLLHVDYRNIYNVFRHPPPPPQFWGGGRNRPAFLPTHQLMQTAWE